MSAHSLNVLVVAATDEELSFAERVLVDNGDRPVSTKAVPDALAKLARSHFDVAAVSLSLPRGDGLALVHHLRALHPEVDVIVMAQAAELQETAHAMALGVLASVMLPLTGDGLMVAVDRARERRILLRERRALAEQEAGSRRRNATYARCAAFVMETDPVQVANLVLETCATEVGSKAGAAYLGEQPTTSRYVRIATYGDERASSSVLDNELVGMLDPTLTVQADGSTLRIIAMGQAELLGVFELYGVEDLPEETRGALEIIGALGTAALSSARKVEAVARTGIKDPDTSAYTFAYFGDVAGREIDRAARHERRFSLLTVGLDGLTAVRRRLDPPAVIEHRRTLADAVLEAVRDSDVVARVEDDELYILLPETGLLGALACRRRIMARLSDIQQLEDLAALDPVVGIAVYPSDGLDLGRLLRASRRRADASRRGVWRRRELTGLDFWDGLDRLLSASGGSVLLDIDVERHERSDNKDLARHAAMPKSLIARIGGTLASDSVRLGLPGTMYVAGDEALAAAVARAVSEAERPKLRAWSLGTEAGSGEATSRIHLNVDDARLDKHIFILSLTELGGYVLLGKPIDDGNVLVYHAADLDLVDGLTTALQSAYHLQPEAR